MLHPETLLREAESLRATVTDWDGGCLLSSDPIEFRGALRAYDAAFHLTYARTMLGHLLRPLRRRDVREFGFGYREDFNQYRKQAHAAVRSAGKALQEARAILAPWHAEGVGRIAEAVSEMVVA